MLSRVGRTMSTYAELQVTTNFTFLHGASHPEELVAQAKLLRLSAIAVTDHNSLAGVVRAHVAARQSNLKLVVGCRLDLQDPFSLLAYPADPAAYGRLTRLLTTGQRRAEKGQCILTLDDVCDYQEGQQQLVPGNYAIILQLVFPQSHKQHLP